MTNLAIVILNFNGSELLRKYLPSVLRYSGSAQIVVVDNGSSDSSVQVIQNEFAQVELIQIPKNLGFCGGYNYALKKVNADFFLLLNSDVEVTDNWLSPMMSALIKNPEIAAVQPKILSYQDRSHFEYAGAGGGLIDTLGYPFCRGRLFYYTEPDNGQYNDQREIFWASGACMMVRANLFHEVGGFDEDFFAHMEEIDLCWRLQRAGYKIFYTGSSTVFHLGGGTLSVSNPRKTYLNFRNGLSLIWKNMTTVELIYKFPMRIVLDWIACLKFTFSGSTQAGKSVIMAHLHFLGNIRKERRRRKLTYRFPFRDLPTQFKGSIVWHFFVQGKRKFLDLDV